MRKVTLVLLVPALTVGFLAAAATAAVVTPATPVFEISPFAHGPDLVSLANEVIEIPPDDIEMFWAHIIWPGHEGESLHIFEVSWKVTIEPEGGANSWVEQWLIQPCMTVKVCEWFGWNVVHTVGQPCTYISFQADVAFHDAAGAPWGPIDSNIVTKHIVPEPSALPALGAGAMSLVGIALRRKK